MQIDNKDHKPVFKQIADELRSRIRKGVHRPGESLPSLRGLAADIRVNPNTVQRAYELLEREGVIETRRGIGVFVADRNTKPESRAEQSFQRRVEKAVESALEKDVSPDRLRAIFEDSMHSCLESGRS